MIARDCAAAAALVTVILAGCGGGASGEVAAHAPPPDSAVLTRVTLSEAAYRSAATGERVELEAVRTAARGTA